MSERKGMNNRQLLKAIVGLPESEVWPAVCELAVERARHYPALVVARKIVDGLAELCEEHGIASGWGLDMADDGMTYSKPNEDARALVREYDRRKKLAWHKRQLAKEPPPDLKLTEKGALPDEQ